MKKLTDFSFYVIENMLEDKIILILKADQLKINWQSLNYCINCFKTLLTYYTKCKTFKKNNAKKVKRKKFIIIQKKIKDIYQEKNQHQFATCR